MRPARTVTLPVWVWLGVVLTLVGAGLALLQRYRVEASNQAVTMAIEWDAVELDAASQRDPVAALSRLKIQGLRGVVVGEDTVAAAFSDGRLDWIPGGVQGDPRTLDALARTLAVRFPRAIPYQRRTPNQLLVTLDRQILRSLTLGLDANALTLARAQGLLVIGRIANAPGAGPAYLEDRLAALNEGEVLLPVGDQVPGFRANSKLTADLVRAGNRYYASAEFAKIAGDATLAQSLTDRLIRLHAIQAAETVRLSPADAVARYGLAARERNIRILLVRPFSDSVSAEVPYPAASAVSAVAKELASERLPLGRARPFADPEVPRPVFVLLGLGIGVVVAGTVVGLVGSKALVLGAMAGVLVAATSLSPSTRNLTALAAAFTYPLFAYLAWSVLRPRSTLASYLLISGLSLTGGLAVAGILTMLPYLVRVEQFTAVKLAHFGPILVLAVWLVGREVDVRAVLASPVRWGTALVSLVVLAVLGLMLVRTGNDAGGAVSGVELRLRGLLDALLYARPRTKEFLLGHPALWVGLALTGWMAHRGHRQTPGTALAAGLIALGAIGQTSIVNTLCHLHTPLTIGLARIGLGLVIGGLVGAGVWAVVQRWPGLRSLSGPRGETTSV